MIRLMFPFVWGCPREWSLLSPPPLRVELTDQHGMMSRAWQGYFKQIYDRLKSQEKSGWK